MEPPIRGAKELMDLPGMFVADIDNNSLEQLRSTRRVVSVELDRRQFALE